MQSSSMCLPTEGVLTTNKMPEDNDSLQPCIIQYIILFCFKHIGGKSLSKEHLTSTLPQVKH